MLTPKGSICISQGWRWCNLKLPCGHQAAVTKSDPLYIRIFSLRPHYSRSFDPCISSRIFILTSAINFPPHFSGATRNRWDKWVYKGTSISSWSQIVLVGSGSVPLNYRPEGCWRHAEHWEEHVEKKSMKSNQQLWPKTGQEGHLVRLLQKYDWSARKTPVKDPTGWKVSQHCCISNLTFTITPFDKLLRTPSAPKGSAHTWCCWHSVTMETPLLELIPEPGEVGNVLGYSLGLVATTGHSAARVLCCLLKCRRSWGVGHVLACLFSVLLAEQTCFHRQSYSRSAWIRS